MDFRRAASEQQRKTERRIITTGYIARDVTHTLDRMMANRLNKTGYRIQESRGALKQEALKDNATFAEKKKYYSRFKNGSESITVKKDEVSSVLRDVGGKYRHMTFSGRRLTSFSLKNGMTFYPADDKVFKTIALARQASETGGSCPVVLNGANEVLVDMFLHGKIRFTDIQDTLEKILDEHAPKFNLDLDGVLEEDKKIREYVRNLLGDNELEGNKG